MNILQLIARLVLDGRGFKAGMREARVAAKDAGKEIQQALVGAFGTGAILLFVKGVVDASNRIKDLSEEFNVTTREVQELDKAAREVGGKSFEDIGAALIKLANARKAASTGDDKLLNLFNKYGMSLSELQNPAVRTIDLLKKLASNLDNLTPTDLADLSELLGKSGQKLAQTLQAINAQKPIKIIEDDQINKIDEATEKLAELKRLSQVSASGPVSRGLGYISNLISNRNRMSEPLTDEQLKIYNEYKKRNDELGKDMVKHVMNAFRFGSKQDRINSERLLQNYASGVILEGKGKVDGVTSPTNITAYAKAKKDAEKAKYEISPETRAKLEDERAKAQADLNDKAVKYSLINKTNSERRLALEKQAQAAIDKANEMERYSNPTNPAEEMKKRNEAIKEREKALGFLSDARSSKTPELSIGSLTGVGQVSTGRNQIQASGDPVLRSLEKQLDVHKMELDTMRGVLGELQKNPPLKVSR